MLNNKEQIKLSLEEFFINVDEIVKPYFINYGYTKKIIKNRSIVLFEKTIEDKYLSTIDYFSYLKYGMKAFRVTFNSLYKYLYTISMNDLENIDTPWKYEDEFDLRKKLFETINRIDAERLLEKIDNELLLRSKNVS